MSKFILVDYSCILNKFYFGFKDHNIVKNGEELFIGDIKGFTYLVERLYKKYPEHRVIFVMDGNCVKKELNENYKANREDRKEERKKVHNNTQYIINLLSSFNHITFARSQEYEADDLIANIAFELKEREASEIIIYSSDKDFWQLANDFKVANEYDKGFKMVDGNLVFQKFGVAVENLLAFRVLDGDKSDNLKAPVARVRTEFKKMFSEMWNPKDAFSFLSSIESFKGTKWEDTANKYLDVIDVVENYVEIMDLGKYSEPENRFKYSLIRSEFNLELVRYFNLRDFEKFIYDYKNRGTVNV